MFWYFMAVLYDLALKKKYIIFNFCNFTHLETKQLLLTGIQPELNNDCVTIGDG